MLRRTITGLLAVSTIAIPLVAAGGVAWGAEAPTSVGVNVRLAATEPGGPEGIAVLKAAENGTSVELFAQNAPAGTSGLVHPGTCDAIGDEITGILGQLDGTSGQVLATISTSLAQLADGAHVIALHPGLDTTTTLACGDIPATAIVDPQPDPQPDPVPPTNAQCEGVEAWLTVVKGHLARIDQLEKDLGLVIGFDQYLNAVASNIGEVQAMIAGLQALPVPEAARPAQEQFVLALQQSVDGAVQLISALQGGDIDAYQAAMKVVQAAAAEVLKARTAIAQLDAQC